jgi:hypothetical protein
VVLDEYTQMTTNGSSLLHADDTDDKNCNKSQITASPQGYAVAQLVEALRYKP